MLAIAKIVDYSSTPFFFLFFLFHNVRVEGFCTEISC